MVLDWGESLFLCTSCWQVFSDYNAWHEHANGPFQDVIEAEKAMREIEPGETIPAGVRVGEDMCWYPGEDMAPVDWTDVQEDDLLLHHERRRVVGRVGHRDDDQLDVETPDGETTTIERSEVAPLGPYRVIRL